MGVELVMRKNQGWKDETWWEIELMRDRAEDCRNSIRRQSAASERLAAEEKRS